MSQPPASSQLTRGYLICITGTVIWSTTAIFIGYLIQTYQIPPLVLAFWRDLGVALALGLVFLFFHPSLLRLERRFIALMVLYGLVLALFNSLWTASVALNGAAVSTVLAYSSAAYTALLAWRFFGETLTPAKIGAVVLSLTGCVLVSGAYDPAAWQVNLLGIVTGLLSGLAFASYSLMGKLSIRRNIPPWTVMLYAFGFAAVFLLVFNWLPIQWNGQPSNGNLFWLGDAWLGWLVLLLLAIGPTIGGYGLYTVSLSYLPASVANLIATLEPAMTATWAFLLLGETLTVVQVLGSSLIILGVILLRLSEDRSLATSASTA
jgi:drug/metabolite transporter (DMT)-like permease